MAAAEVIVSNASAQTIPVSATVFGVAYNESLIHQVVTAYLAAGRAGTKAQQTRAEVSGGGIKPWRQKGTGRARAGTSNSPIWVGGGLAFAAKPRDFSQKVNRKMYRGAMRSILSELLRQNRLFWFAEEQFQLKQPKTKDFFSQLLTIAGNSEFNTKLKDRVLLVFNYIDDTLGLAARNLHYVGLKTADSLDPVNLLKYDKIYFSEAALKVVTEGLG
jgi:large subunit ribosomal protein L4